ncbi:DUF937 domain-containing protein [Rhodobacteraceae bacterium NNCM2]|nr:DUF937 domain-containing protein [Coraliihabitans acroporae]
MSLLNMLQQAQGGQGLGALARQFGLDEQQVNGLAEILAPTIATGAKKRAEQPGGVEAMLGQMMGENQGRYLDDPTAAAAPEAQAEGEQFLEQIFGSREATQELGQAAAERSGVQPDIVSQLMPAIAAMMQGGMQREMPDSSIQGMMESMNMGGGASQSGGGLMGMIGSLLGGASSGGQDGGLDFGALANMLDADGDGSPLDDILERVMR